MHLPAHLPERRRLGGGLRLMKQLAEGDSAGSAQKTRLAAGFYGYCFAFC